MSNLDANRPRPIIFGCAGAVLTPGERSFFADINPLGFILFQRNCVSRDQIRQLIDELKTSVSRDDVPILIDQEGGRVARLQPPLCPVFPAAQVIGDTYRRDHDLGIEAAKIVGTLIGHELAKLGITVNCAPVLDLTEKKTHDALGDRLFGGDPGMVAILGRAFADGLIETGVLPVMKHMPGHGRAAVDPHLSLPVVDASKKELEDRDIRPFRALNDLPIGMNCHVMFKSLDPKRPASLSPDVIQGLIRQAIGFDGLLLSDDMDMKALTGQGRLEDIGRDGIKAGNDVLLYCSGSMPGMVEIARDLPRMNDMSMARWQRAKGRVRNKPLFVDVPGLTERLDMILAASAFSS